MYVYTQERSSGVPPGIGWLDAFATSGSKKEAIRRDKASRLEEEIERLAAGALWTGVDRAYRKWLKVRDDTDRTKWPIYKLAAEAAANLGDACARYLRVWKEFQLLKRAESPAEEQTRLKAEKQDLGDNWGLVSIRLMRRLRSPITYPAPGWVLRRGDGAKAFERASKQLRKTRQFKGLLPIGPFGRFSIDGQDIPQLSDDCALARASLVSIRQKSDGTFEKECEPRSSTAERDPPLISPSQCSP